MRLVINYLLVGLLTILPWAARSEARADTIGWKTGAFIKSVGPNSASVILSGNAERVEFSGYVPKNAIPNSLGLGGANYITNVSNSEYRIVSFDYVLDLDGLMPEEVAESDIGVTILPEGQAVALNSNQEMLVTHQYDAMQSDRGVSHARIPYGGFSLPPHFRVAVGSGSSVASRSTGQIEMIDANRVKGGKLLALYFRVLLVRADLIKSNAIVSYRSPFRDRAYVATPLRKATPFTQFRNDSSKPVRTYGIGLFFSNISDFETSTNRADVFLNGKLVRSIPAPPHDPARSSAQFPIMLPLHMSINPRDEISIRGTVGTRRAIIFDFAAYLIADEGLVPVDELLDVLNVDLNGDHLPDIIDIDSVGSVWVSLRIGSGLQDTQQEWAQDVRFVDSLVIGSRSPRSGLPILRATNAKGLCLDLESQQNANAFAISYCRDGAVPDPSRYIWADFDGDGWIDRMRIGLDPPIYYVALGGPQGLQAETPWLSGYKRPDKIFPWIDSATGKWAIEAEWTDPAAPSCVIIRTVRSSFGLGKCGHF